MDVVCFASFPQGLPHQASTFSPRHPHRRPFPTAMKCLLLALALSFVAAVAADATPITSVRQTNASANYSSYIMPASPVNRIVLVTGATRGIGFEFVRLLAQQQPLWTILLGARSPAHGAAALLKLTAEEQSHVEVVPLDVDDQASINAAASYVQTTHGHLDVLVHNAGISSNRTHESAVQTIQTNVYGVHDVTEAFRAMMPSGGQILIVTSQSSCTAFESASAAFQAELEPLSDWPTLDRLMQGYLASTEPPDYPQRQIYPRQKKSFGAYGTSKLFVASYGRMLAREERGSGSGLSVLLVSPGWCATSLNKFNGPRTPRQGAISYAMALGRGPEETGKFYLDRELLECAGITP